MTCKHETFSLSGMALDYALAEALLWTEPFYGVGKIRYIEEDKFFMMEQPDPDEPDDITEPHHFNHYRQWRPQKDKSIIALLLVKYQIDIRWGLGKVTASKGCMSNTHPNLGTAIARVFVAHRFGLHVNLPKNIKNEGGNDDLVN